MALTNNDVSKIINAFSLILNKTIGHLKEEINAKISHLPTKEEYYKREDKMMKELKEIREEITVLSGHSSEHSDRLEDLEEIHPRNKHYAVA